MAISYVRGVAFCCAECDTVAVKEMSIFDMSGGGAFPVLCECGDVCVRVELRKGKIQIAVECPDCLQTHRFSVSAGRFWNGEPLEFFCPNSGMGVLFIGNADECAEYAERQRELYDAIAEYSGMMDELEFQNDNIMLQTLERIHKIASEGNIFCSCGGDISFCLESNSVILTCGKCGAEESIPAANEDDLRRVLERECIVLTRSEHKPSPRR